MSLNIYYLGRPGGANDLVNKRQILEKLSAKLAELGYTIVTDDTNYTLTVSIGGEDYLLPMDIQYSSSNNPATAGLLLMVNPDTNEIITSTMYAGVTYSTHMTYTFGASILLCRTPEGTGLQVIRPKTDTGMASYWADRTYGAFGICLNNDSQNPTDYVVLTPAVCRGRQILVNCYVAPLYLVAGTALEVDGERFVCLGGPLYYKL